MFNPNSNLATQGQIEGGTEASHPLPYASKEAFISCSVASYMHAWTAKRWKEQGNS